MAEILAGVTAFASIAGLADVCCRLAGSLYRSTCAIKDAPQSIRELSERLSQLHTLLEDVDRLINRYSTSSLVLEEGYSTQAIKAPLDACHSELVNIREFVAKFDSKVGKLNSLPRRAKWMLDEHKLEQHCNTLEHLAGRIGMALEVAGRYHDISTSESHRKLGTQLVGLHTSLAGTELMVSTESANIQNSLGLISSEVSRGQDSIQTQLSVTGDNVCRQVLHSGNTMAQMTGAMRGDLRRLEFLYRRNQQRSQKQLRRLGQGKHQLTLILDQLSSLHLESQKGSPNLCTAQHSGLENMAFVLLQMRASLDELISELRSTSSFKDLNDEVDLLLDEYKRLVAFYHESGASDNHEKLEFIDKQEQDLDKSCAIFDGYSQGLAKESLPKTMKRIYSYRKTQSSHLGRLEVHLEKDIGDCNGLPTTSQRASFHFIPHSSGSSAGVYAAFCKTYQLACHPCINRTLREIRRLGSGDIRNKLGKALIFDDLPTVQQMLSFGHFKPWYRFVNEDHMEAVRILDDHGRILDDNGGGNPHIFPGRNLIELAAEFYYICSIEGAVFQYLLQGAWDIENSNDLQNILWGRSTYRTTPAIDRKDFEGARAQASLDACRLGQPLSDAFFHSLFSENGGLWSMTLGNEDTDSVRQYFELFLRLGMNPEYIDPESGRSLFLSVTKLNCARGLHPSLTVSWLQVFLEYGADVTVVDHVGRGPLHLTMERSRTNFYLNYDRLLYIHQTIILLLRAGCSVDAVDVYGYTPGDLARENHWEDAWIDALEETGMLTDEIMDEVMEEVHKKVDQFGFHNWFDFYENWVPKEEEEYLTGYGEREEVLTDYVGRLVEFFLFHQRDYMEKNFSHLLKVHGDNASSEDDQSEDVDNTDLSPSPSSASESTIPPLSKGVSTNADQSNPDNMRDIIGTGQHHIWM